MPDAIRARYRDGALVGGTSAGAAVMSASMITGEADLQSITAAKTELKPGLGLWPEVIVDQHFLKRQRNNRLISAVLDHPELVGVGVDETTAVFVTGREFEVLGKNSVVVIDARKAAVDKTPAGGLATGRGLVMSVLKEGMKFDLGKIAGGWQSITRDLCPLPTACCPLSSNPVQRLRRGPRSDPPRPRSPTE